MLNRCLRRAQAGAPQVAEEVALDTIKVMSEFTIPKGTNVMETLPEKLGFEDAAKVGNGFFGHVFVGLPGPRARKVFTEMIPILDLDFLRAPKVAIKIIQVSTNSMMLESYQDEAKALQGIKNPKIVQHYATFVLEGTEDKDGNNVIRRAGSPLTMPTADKSLYCIILMECLGFNFRTIMYEKLNLRCLGEHEIKHIFLEIGTALAHLHKNRIIHNDLQQGNIVTTFTGDHFTRGDITGCGLKLIDFGVAKRRDVPDGTFDVAVQQSAELVKSWQNEDEFINRTPLEASYPINWYLRDAHFFGLILIRLSMLSGVYSHGVDSSNLLKIFQQEAKIKSPALRQALMMLGTPDKTLQITIMDALTIVQSESV